MTSKWGKRGLLFTLILAAIVALRFTFFAPKPIEISVYTAQKGKVEETVTNSKAGTVKARKRAKLSPEIGGRVNFLGAREGERVKKDQVLLRLEDSELRASLSLAERSYQSTEAAKREACLAADLAQRELQRNESLSLQGIVSEAQLDQVRNRRDASRARCDASRSESRRSQASIEVAKANLKRTELRAPFDGVIAQLTTEVGEWITPSPPGVPIPPVIDILDNDSIYVLAPIDETDAGKLHPQFPARISLDPFPDQSFPGRLARIAPFVKDVEGQNRTVDIEVEFSDRKFAQTLLPGTSADVEIVLKATEEVLRIPTYALMEGSKVLVVEQNRLVSKTVKTGLRNWEYVEIREGVKEGDRIAVSLELAEVKEGVLVKVKEQATK